MHAVRTRMTADERREDILAVALVEFGEHGLHGTSTDTIAQQGRRLAAVPLPTLRHEEGALPRVRAALPAPDTSSCSRRPRAGKTGEEALDAIGKAYRAAEDRISSARADAVPTPTAATTTSARSSREGYGSARRVRRAGLGRRAGAHPRLLRVRDAARTSSPRWTSSTRTRRGPSSCSRSCLRRRRNERRVFFRDEVSER